VETPVLTRIIFIGPKGMMDNLLLPPRIREPVFLCILENSREGTGSQPEKKRRFFRYNYRNYSVGGAGT
ncbi:TPA: hypothetical protein ACTNQY_004257, partial [Salmonella enterica subsp. enterica serovar Enteritidis]